MDKLPQIKSTVLNRLTRALDGLKIEDITTSVLFVKAAKENWDNYLYNLTVLELSIILKAIKQNKKYTPRPRRRKIVNAAPVKTISQLANEAIIDCIRDNPWRRESFLLSNVDTEKRLFNSQLKLLIKNNRVKIVIDDEKTRYALN